MSFKSCKIDCEGLHQCLLQWSHHGVKTVFLTLILLTLHFHTQGNRTFKLISALPFRVLGGIIKWRVLGLEWNCTAHLNHGLGFSWFILFTHYMIAVAKAITFSFQAPCFWSHCGSYSFQWSSQGPRRFQWVQWLACANILPLCVGNRWVNTAESLKHFPSLLLDYQLPFRASSAEMSAKINGALSAKLIRSRLALLLLIRDYSFLT